MIPEKKLFLMGLLFIIVFSLSYPVSAHFVCGQVLNSPQNVSAAWLPVKIFYPSSPSNFTACEVSPDGNKYCCDAEAIPSSTPWKIGDTVNAGVYSPQTGYVAGPVSIVTTGEGYDLFPDMQIQKVINIFSPIQSLIISSTPSLFLNSSFLSPYNHVTLSNDSSKILLCDNCTSFSGKINLSYGMNSLNLSASSGNLVFSQNINLALLKKITFQRSFTCNGCGKSTIPPDQNFSVSIFLNLSNSISNFQLEEYVPSDFLIINTTGSVQSYNSTYNVIIWNISGRNIYENYTVVSPHIVWPLSYSYEFYSSLGGININSEEVKVRNFFDFVPIRVPPHKNFGYYGGTYPVISPGRPYVLSGNYSIEKLAFFPKSAMDNAHFGLISGNVCSSVKGVVGCYSVTSSSSPNYVNRTYIEFKVPKSSSSNPSDISLLSFVNGWQKQNITFVGQDSQNMYFSGFFTGNEIAIVNKNYKDIKIPSILNPGDFLSLNNLMDTNLAELIGIQGRIIGKIFS